MNFCLKFFKVSENSKKVLEDHFEFMSCGTKFIKGKRYRSEDVFVRLLHHFMHYYVTITIVHSGKGMMETFLLVRPDEDQRVIKPNPRPDDYPQFNLPPTN